MSFEVDYDPTQSRGFKLLQEQANDLRALAANPRRRVPTGFPSIDMICGGPTAGEVATFCGRSYVGKSLIATNIMANNPDRRIIFFSLEMPEAQVLQRLYAHLSGIDSWQVDQMMRRNELPDSINYVFNDYERHVVVDSASLTLSDMAAYIDMYEAWFGDRPEAVIIDYLEEVGGGKASAEGWQRTEATASALKAWAKQQRLAVFVLHQANQKTEPWEPITASSGKGGGMTEADLFIGIWRPGLDPDWDDAAKEMAKNDLHMNMLKNRINGREVPFDLKFPIDHDLRLIDRSEARVREAMR